MVEICFRLLLNGIAILVAVLISRRCFKNVHIKIPKVAEEADGSGSLHLFCVDVEGCGSVSERGVNKLSCIQEKRLGTTFELSWKTAVTLNSEL
jgi:hypothetical protein